MRLTLRLHSGVNMKLKVDYVQPDVSPDEEYEKDILLSDHGWQSGMISETDGSITSSSSRLVTEELIPVTDEMLSNPLTLKIYLTNFEDTYNEIAYFDPDGQFIAYRGWNNSANGLAFPDNTGYIRLAIRRSGNGSMAVPDLIYSAITVNFAPKSVTVADVTDDMTSGNLIGNSWFDARDNTVNEHLITDVNNVKRIAVFAPFTHDRRSVYAMQSRFQERESSSEYTITSYLNPGERHFAEYESFSLRTNLYVYDYGWFYGRDACAYVKVFLYSRDSSDYGPLVYTGGMIGVFSSGSFDAPFWKNSVTGKDIVLRTDCTCTDSELLVPAGSGGRFVTGYNMNSTGTIYVIAKNSGSGSGAGQYFITNWRNGGIEIGSGWGESNIVFRSNANDDLKTNISSLEYHLCAVSYSNGRYRAFVDGVFVGEKNMSTSDTNNLNLGFRNYSGQSSAYDISYKFAAIAIEAHTDEEIIANSRAIMHQG